MGSNTSRFGVADGPTFHQRLEAIKGRRRHSTTLSKKHFLSHREQDMKISVSSRPSDGGTRPSSYSLGDIITNKPTPDQEIKIETKGSVGIAIIIAANNYDVMKVVAQDNTPIVINNDAKKESHKPKVTFVGMDDDDDDDDDNDDDDGDDDDERRIGHADGEAFPGSPSFRVYFEENREHSHNQTVKYEDDIPGRVSAGDIVPPKVYDQHFVQKNAGKKVKSEGKKRCFRKVLPKRGSQADVKKMLNMKSCYC